MPLRFALPPVLLLTLAVLPALADISPTTQPSDSQPLITPLRAAVLGIVEGITEYLPVSSTGHLILTGHFLGLNESASKEAVAAFEVVIQFGAIIAVVGLYRRRVGQMLSGLAGRNRAGLRLFGLLMVAFAPAAVFGLWLDEPIKKHLFRPEPVIAALAIGGVLMIGIEMWRKRRLRSDPAAGRQATLESLTFRMALLIGLAQCLAMWPGTSRSMVTILAAVLVGLEIKAAAEFSFLLALPTLSAACLYDLVKHRTELMQSAGPTGMLIGLAVSAIVAAVAVRTFVSYLGRSGLEPFGYYRILVAIAMLGLVLAGQISF